MTQIKDFFFIQRENMPCVYELSWDRISSAIIVRIHRDFVQRFSVPLDAWIVLHFMKEFSFSFFDGNFNGTFFGFDNALQKNGEGKDFISFKINIPVFEKQSDTNCSRCHGTGKEESSERDCLACRGEGKESVFNWKPMYAISASLTIFFELAFLKFNKEDKTSCGFPQLITIETHTEKQIHGGTLGGVYSIPLANFLSSFQPKTEITEMTDAMIGSWRKMFCKLSQYDKYSFYSQVANKNGWLNVGCPGDACGLHPGANEAFDPGRGSKFSCHNVDTPMQQIALLAALAALCDKARKEIKSY